MLNKTAAHPTLQHDSDLKLFLESEAFNVDVKHKERKEPGLGESKGMFSGLSISVGGGGKFIEQDDVSSFSAKICFADFSSGSTTGGYTSMHSRTSLKHC